MQEGICADAASFDLPAAYLSTCISEAKQCVDLCIKRRVIEKSSDKQHDPDNYAILRGNYTMSDDCVHACMRGLTFMYLNSGCQEFELSCT